MLIKILMFFLMVGGAVGIVLVGILSAFWPINDQATSAVCRAAWLGITVVLLSLWLQLF
jgi:hypothetical protein